MCCSGQRGPVIRSCASGEGEEVVHAAQLVSVQGAEPAEEMLILIGQDHPDSARVVGIRRPLHQSLVLRPVDQFHHAVVAHLKAIGELAYQRPVASRVSLDRQHELVLLGCDAVTAHRLLAEPQVAPDAEAQTGQRLEVRFGQGINWLCRLI
jgi:hypothetical protein